MENIKFYKSLATIICAVIKSDKEISQKEEDRFNEFFTKELNLSSKEAQDLFKEAINSNNYEQHLSILKEEFKNKPMEMMKFMQFLNNTITSDGIKDSEYRVFEKIRDEFL